MPEPVWPMIPVKQPSSIVRETEERALNARLLSARDLRDAVRMKKEELRRRLRALLAEADELGISREELLADLP